MMDIDWGSETKSRCCSKLHRICERLSVLQYHVQETLASLFNPFLMVPRLICRQSLNVSRYRRGGPLSQGLALSVVVCRMFVSRSPRSAWAAGRSQGQLTPLG